jgi:hypothetical protein
VKGTPVGTSTGAWIREIGNVTARPGENGRLHPAAAITPNTPSLIHCMKFSGTNPIRCMNPPRSTAPFEAHGKRDVSCPHELFVRNSVRLIRLHALPWIAP